MIIYKISRNITLPPKKKKNSELINEFCSFGIQDNYTKVKSISVFKSNIFLYTSSEYVDTEIKNILSFIIT